MWNLSFRSWNWQKKTSALSRLQTTPVQIINYKYKWQLHLNHVSQYCSGIFCGHLIRPLLRIPISFVFYGLTESQGKLVISVYDRVKETSIEAYIRCTQRNCACDTLLKPPIRSLARSAHESHSDLRESSSKWRDAKHGLSSKARPWFARAAIGTLTFRPVCADWILLWGYNNISVLDGVRRS